MLLDFRNGIVKLSSGSIEKRLWHDLTLLAGVHFVTHLYPLKSVASHRVVCISVDLDHKLIYYFTLYNQGMLNSNYELDLCNIFQYFSSRSLFF